LGVRSQGTASGEISISGNTVSYGGVAIGILSGGTNSSPLAIDLNTNATPQATEALIRNITFSSSSENPGTANRRLKFQVNDGDGGPSGGLSNEAFTLVEVVAVNDALSITVS